MSLLYFWSGSLDFDSLAESWSSMGELEPLAGIGVGLMLVAFGFKVSAAPFHLAAPDADGIIPWLQSVDPFFLLAIAIVLNSALSLFYYLRIGLVMFFEKPEIDLPLSPAFGLRALVVISMIFTVLFGIGPASQWLLVLVETAIASF